MDHVAVQSKPQLCVICGAPSNASSFVVFACQACVAFFRRCRDQHYRCRRDNKCDIAQEGQRTSCRACRLRKCYEAGMTWNEGNHDSVSTSQTSSPAVHYAHGQSEREPATATMLSPQLWANAADAASSISHSYAENPLLRKLLADFKMLRNAQRSLYAIENPNSVFYDVQYRPVTFPEYWRMESGTLSLVFSMLSETLELFDLHGAYAKADVLKAYTYKFTTLFAAYSTVKVFPSASDNRIATHYGYYMSSDTVETTFGAASGVALMNGLRADVDVKPLLAPMWENRRKSIDKLSRLQVREFEMAALAGTLLWEQLDRMGLVTPAGEEIRSRMYADFHNEVLAQYGPLRGPVRIVKLLSFVEDVADTVASYRELELMGRIFIDAACPNAYVDPEKIVARVDASRAT